MSTSVTPTIEPAESPLELDHRTREFYLDAMRLLDDAAVETLVGGAYALAHHAGIIRHTKDFDVFVRRRDLDAAREAFESAGFRTELVFPHWLAKAFLPRSDAFVDIIYSSGNGVCDVDDEWFAHAVTAEVFDRPARLVPAEEVIWTKVFIQERERFDGADINHVLLRRARELNWPRLLRRFAGHEPLLLAHLITFRHVYPAAHDTIPPGVMEHLLHAAEHPTPVDHRLCRGTLISRAQYLPDIRDGGFLDARLSPFGRMRAEDVAHWTAAIGTIR
jgi:hypothetical protein